MVTYAEHITWSEYGYVLSFGSSRSFFLFTAYNKCDINLDYLLGLYVLFVHLVKM